jgi:hypothetical protein
MRPVCFTLWLVVALAAPWFTGVADAAEYWPVGTQRIYHYATGTGGTATMEFSGEFWHISYFYDGRFTYSQSRRFGVSDAGDILLYEDSQFTAGAIDPDYIVSYDPPVTFLESPVTPEASWRVTTTASGYPSGEMHYAYSLSSEETITVPYGTFSVLEISVFDLQYFRFTDNYFLDRGLGPVMLSGGLKLIDIDFVVLTEGQSWGRLKALYH